MMAMYVDKDEPEMQKIPLFVLIKVLLLLEKGARLQRVADKGALAPVVYESTCY